MIKALEKTSQQKRQVLRSLLIQRREAGCAVLGQKELMLDIFKESGAMHHTFKMLSMLWDQILAEIRILEGCIGRENTALMRILYSLSPPKGPEGVS